MASASRPPASPRYSRKSSRPTNSIFNLHRPALHRSVLCIIRLNHRRGWNLDTCTISVQWRCWLKLLHLPSSCLVCLHDFNWLRPTHASDAPQSAIAITCEEKVASCWHPSVMQLAYAMNTVVSLTGDTFLRDIAKITHSEHRCWNFSCMEHLQNQFFEREGVENWVQRMYVESNQCYKPEPTPFLAHDIAHPLVTLSVGNNYALYMSRCPFCL